MKKNNKKNKKLFSTLAKILELNPSKINVKSSNKNLDEWDSLGSLNIMSFLDKKFRNKMKKFHVEDATSVKSIIKLLDRNKIKL